MITHCAKLKWEKEKLIADKAKFINIFLKQLKNLFVISDNKKLSKNPDALIASLQCISVVIASFYNHFSVILAFLISQAASLHHNSNTALSLEYNYNAIYLSFIDQSQAFSNINLIAITLQSQNSSSVLNFSYYFQYFKCITSLKHHCNLVLNHNYNYCQQKCKFCN